MNDTKRLVLGEIEKVVPLFKPAGNFEYRIRCPVCGDSTNPNSAHCYIKCSNDPTEPLLYHCFRCGSSGLVNRAFLKRLAIDDSICDQIDEQRVNRLPYNKERSLNVLNGNPIENSLQKEYISYRLGAPINLDDLEKFKIVWDMELLKEAVPTQKIRHMLPSNMDSISFLSDDKTLLITRTFEPGSHQWNKIHLFPSDMKSFYTVKAELDLFTRDEIAVHIAEGIMDILSVYKNFAIGKNNVCLAVLGSDYVSGVNYVIEKGIMGANVSLNIYMDADQSETELRKSLKKYKWIFKCITIKKNLISKDVGVPLDQIRLIDIRV